MSKPDPETNQLDDHRKLPIKDTESSEVYEALRNEMQVLGLEIQELYLNLKASRRTDQYQAIRLTLMEKNERLQLLRIRVQQIGLSGFCKTELLLEDCLMKLPSDHEQRPLLEMSLNTIRTLRAGKVQLEKERGQLLQVGMDVAKQHGFRIDGHTGTCLCSLCNLFRIIHKDIEQATKGTYSGKLTPAKKVFLK